MRAKSTAPKRAARFPMPKTKPYSDGMTPVKNNQTTFFYPVAWSWACFIPELDILNLLWPNTCFLIHGKGFLTFFKLGTARLQKFYCDWFYSSTMCLTDFFWQSCNWPLVLLNYKVVLCPVNPCLSGAWNLDKIYLINKYIEYSLNASEILMFGCSLDLFRAAHIR